MKRFIIRPETKPQMTTTVTGYLQLLNITEPIEVVIKPYKRNRSQEQNRLYWKWVDIIGKELGYEKDEMHDILVFKFLGMVDKEIDGKKFEQLAETKKLKVGEMSDYLNSIERWVGELGIRLPAMERDYE